MDGLNPQCLCHNLPWIECPAPSGSFCPGRSPFTISKKYSNILPPFATDAAFGSAQASSCRQAAGHSGFILSSVTRLLWPELQHYYGFICHLAPHRIISSFLLMSPIPDGNSARLPRLRREPCERCHPQSHH